MAWVKIDDGYLTHPKALAAGKDGRALFLAGLMHSARHLTDGHLDRSALPLLAAAADVRSPQRVADRLVEVGHWERADDGWVIHDYLEYQPSRADVETQREQERKRKRKQRQRSGRDPDTGQFCPDGSPDGTPEGQPPEVEESPAVPVPYPSLDAEHPPPDSSNAPDESGGVMVEAAWLMAWDETNRRGSDIGNPEGYARSRFKPLLKDNQDRWAQVIAANPEVTAQELVAGLAPSAEPHPTEGTAAAQLRKMAENAQRMADEPEPDPSGLGAARAALGRAS